MLFILIFFFCDPVDAINSKVIMEESQQNEIGKWRSLPDIPLEYQISVGQRTVFHRGKIYALFGQNNKIFINCYDIGKHDCAAQIKI